jgi:L-xylulokinase
MDGYLLGLDNGGTVSKAALFDLNGKEIAVSSNKTEMIFPHPGFTERSVPDFWHSNVKAISAVIKKSGIDPALIKAVAATGYGNGIIMVDEWGEPTYNAIISTDSRAKEYIKKWNNDGTSQYAFERTASDIWAAQPVTLLAWFQDNMPEVLRKTKWVFMCKDYIRYKLTGQAFAEITDYSGTSAMNLHTKTFDKDLFKRFGIEDCYDFFPPVRMSSEICGYVTKEAALLTGLKEGTPVAGGLFDIHACCLSSGIIDGEKLCLVTGTWSINEYLSDVMIDGVFMNSISCIPGYYLISEASPTSASNLEWFINELMPVEKEIADDKGESIYEKCNEMVERTQEQDSEIVFLPYLFGSNSSLNARACFLGLSSWHKREHVMRAIFEGIVFSSKHHVDNLMKHRSMPEIARISGGPSRSETWMQMFADTLQVPIEVVAGTELGALGAAICAGVAAGVFGNFSEAVDSMVKVSGIYYPDPLKREMYEKKYERYKKAVEITDNYWELL